MIDPWSSSNIDYDKLVNKFGIQDISPELEKLDNLSPLMRRGIIFSHRDFDKIVEAINNKKDFAVVTGMMPSGKMHVGHKMVVDQLKWYDSLGATLSLPIADMEAYAARGMESEESKKLAIDEYLSNYIALGLDLRKNNIHVYLQSEFEELKNLAFELSKKVTFNEMKAIYGFTGSTSIAHTYIPMVQVADILVPQIPEFGGPKHVVVPVGPDQDPHVRLTRDIAERFKSKYSFIAPSSTYHRFITGLTGGKMSSSNPKTAIFLSDTPEEAEKKVKTAKTGGRESLKEQKELGGCPDKCVIYELLLYHLIDSDEELEEIYSKCSDGTLLCGECKNLAGDLIRKFLEDFSKKREKSLKIAESLFD